MEIEYKFMEKYNPSSNRLQNFDYSSNGAYFITICTKDREEYFGKIIDGKMILNEYGRIVEKYFLEIPKHFRFVILDKIVIMPDHIHGIIILNNNSKDMLNSKDVAMLHLYSNDGSNYNCNEKFSKKYYSKISPKKGELGTIIRSFKSICTREINKVDKQFFAWHPNYYDRIIRNEDELNRIRKYILENPLKWELEKNNPENIFM